MSEKINQGVVLPFIGDGHHALDMSREIAAASMIEEMAALEIAETKKKGAFVLPGIGKSVLVKRKARKGRNPGTGQEIKIPAKTVVRIRPAKAFKEAIVPAK